MDHNSINAALEEWRQGDCVIEEQWFVYRFDANCPLSEDAKQAAESSSDLTESAVAGFVVVSQTCDIVRSCSDRPFVEIAPVVKVAPHDMPSIQSGRRPRYAFIPGISIHNLVADLDRTMTIEKGVVAGWTRKAGCLGDDDVRRFAQALARKRSRFAFPNDFVNLMKPFQKRIQKKHGRDSAEGHALNALREIRVRAAPSWDSSSVELMFWFIREDEEPTSPSEDWSSQLKGWLKLIPSKGRFKTIKGVVVALDDLTARDYVESDPLDLDHLSDQPS